jgi:selenocysteine-specific elongation factor
LTLGTVLPLRIGDRALLRDAGRHRIAAGITVLDVLPPPLRRRGSAAARAAELATMDGRPDGEQELRRRLLIRSGELVAMGATPPVQPTVGVWLVEPAHRARLAQRLLRIVEEHAAQHPLEHGMPAEAARRRLDLPDLDLVYALVAPPLRLAGGRISRAAPSLPPAIERPVTALRDDLAERPYAAPDSNRLAELGLGPRELAAAVRAGALAKIAEGIYLLPGALESVTDVLSELPQPFTVSQARAALGTARRVAVPLLELLDARGRTQRLPDDRRRVVGD